MFRRYLGWIVGAVIIIGMVAMIWLLDRPETATNKSWLDNLGTPAAHPANKVYYQTPSPTLPPPTKEIQQPSPNPAISYSSEAEQFEAEMIARHVVEPIDKVILMTDAAISAIERSGVHSGMRVPDRLDFLHLAGGVIEDADEKPQVRRTYKLKKVGDKYHYSDISAAVMMNIAVASGLDKSQH